LSHSDNINLDEIRLAIDPYIATAKLTIKILTSIKDASQDDIKTAYEFIFHTLPNLSKEIKDLLNKDGRKYHTAIFQKLGDNVRRSGSPLSEEIDTSKLLALPEAIARIIKLARARNRINNKKTNYFVVDALRHPFEIRYLRERISPFYTLAVTTDDFDRKARLHQNSFIPDDIIRLDEKEYPSEIKEFKKKPQGYAAFVSQDIQACLAISDIYISNLGRPETKDLRSTAQQVCRYIALMQHPGLVTPTHIERCMHTAFSAKINSGCVSRQVGAVVTDPNYSIKAIGWNDVPKGQVPCLLRNTAHAVSKGIDESAYSNFERSEEFLKELKKSKFGNKPLTYIGGRNITFCFKSVYNSLKGDNNQVHTRALHAEENAFLQIAKYGGQGIEGGCLFTTASPCELCAKKAYQLGVKKIYYIDPYPGISKDQILSVGSNSPELKLFSGAIGRAYHNLYESIMAYKDELAKIFPPNALIDAPKSQKLDM
jgi:dCMP deaminase